jgi:hypothetical protein
MQSENMSTTFLDCELPSMWTCPSVLDASQLALSHRVYSEYVSARGDLSVLSFCGEMVTRLLRGENPLSPQASPSGRPREYARDDRQERGGSTATRRGRPSDDSQQPSLEALRDAVMPLGSMMYTYVKQHGAEKAQALFRDLLSSHKTEGQRESTQREGKRDL